MRPSRALIDLDALRHNYHLARGRHGGRALAVVKANAYGHGAVECARALAPDVDGFAVAFLEEALELRAAGIDQPILLLEGIFEPEELDEVVRHDLWMVVHHAEQIRLIDHAKPALPLEVWLKMNSGLNRAGFLPHELRAAFDAAPRALPGPRSLANSGAILGWPDAHRDWARPGILLYGADPMLG